MDGRIWNLCYWAFFLCSSFVGCAEFQSAEVGIEKFSSGRLLPPVCLKEKVEARAIYGVDNRREVYQVPGIAAAYWAEASLALMTRSSLFAVEDDWLVTAPSYGETQKLCPGTLYEEQPQAAFCSGFLVSEKLVVTAGHCFLHSKSCQEVQFVFGYSKKSAAQENYLVRGNDVYGCRRVLAFDFGESDYAVIELNRPVIGRTPLNLRREGTVRPGEELVLVGHPVGLPTKVAAGGVVLRQGQFIVASVDSFVGNSGSPVINAKTGLVEGLLASGELDFVSEGGCQKENRCLEGSCRGETVIPIADIVDWIPDIEYRGPESICDES